MNSTVVKGLYDTHWYNDEPKEPGFLPDLYSNLFGGSRIRQLRVKNGKFCFIYYYPWSLCHSWIIIDNLLTLFYCVVCVRAYTLLNISGSLGSGDISMRSYLTKIRGP